MPRFYPLQVTNVQPDTRHAVIVTLRPRPEDARHFDFEHGQYLTFRKEFEGAELRRSYSICAPRKDGQLRVGIKRVDGGWFSTWANEELQIGDALEAMPPMGRFNTPIDPEASRHYLGFAVGSGITPMISIMKTVLDEEPNSTFTLVFGNRSVNSIMFREEIDDLKNTYMTRFNTLHILKNDGGDIDLLNGRIDREKCDRLFSTWIDVSRADYAFICGPEPMMKMLSEALEDHGMPKDQIKFELFASSQPGRMARKTKSSAASVSHETSHMTVILDGVSRSFQTSIDTPLLDAALAQNIDAPYSCKAGVCSTCVCRVIEGEVEMFQNHALEDYEVERGFVLSCQAISLSKRVVIDYDQH